MDALSVLAAVAIIVSLTIDVLFDGTYEMNNSYLAVQLSACTVFLMDFFVRQSAAVDKRRFWAANWLVLLVSIPYLNFMHWFGVELGKDMYLFLKSIPLVRGFWAVWLVVLWLGGRNASGLLWAYILTVAGFTYFSALMFFAYELGVNPKVDTFGNSIWWAWMSVSTVGAAVFPVTTIGKILAVALPCLGMMMFPVFTIYITSRIKSVKGDKARE